MKVLLNDQYAPITECIGFIEAPLDVVAPLLYWLRRGYYQARWLDYHKLGSLAPLKLPPPMATLPAALRPETAIDEEAAEQEGRVKVSRPKEPFPKVLHHLEPLMAPGFWKELLLSTTGQWTAYLNNSIDGTDPYGAVRFLSRHFKCRGLIVRCTPHTLRKSAGELEVGRYGCLSFELYAPEKTEGSNPMRSIRLDGPELDEER
jgi:hypothetical protein